MTLRKVSQFAAAIMIATAVAAEDKPDLKDPKMRGSYCIGANIGSSLKDFDVDPKAVAAGIADAFANKLALTEDERTKVLGEFQQQLMVLRAAKNLKEGEAFLAANARKDGVKTTTSGLQYKVLKSGTGPVPKASDEVKVHYHGTLTDGTVFDSSVGKDPVSFPVEGVIPGWVEALQMMKVGDKWQLTIPSKLAYGENPPPRSLIQPNTVLVFEVELLAINKADDKQK